MRDCLMIRKGSRNAAFASPGKTGKSDFGKWRWVESCPSKVSLPKSLRRLKS